MVLVEPLQQKIVGDPSEAPKPLTEKLVFVPTWVSPIVEAATWYRRQGWVVGIGGG